MYAIETDRLVKKFGDLTAVNSIDLKIKKGELFGFLGPNGAGKTTTIRMLTTLAIPTSGSAKVAGYDLLSEAPEVRARIGIVPQQAALFEELTPMENLWFVGKLFGMKEGEIRERSNELLKIVSLHDKREVRVSTFSGGMKQRMSVAVGLLHEPEILFMDEPTIGLDPQSRIALRELTKELNGRGITVVYTTHDMEEADKLCDRIAIMDRGTIVAQGTSEELKEKIAHQHTLEVEMERVTDAVVAELKRKPAVKTVARSGNKLTVATDTPAACFELAEFFRKKKVRDVSMKSVSLEDVFIKLTKKDLRE